MASVHLQTKWFWFRILLLSHFSLPPNMTSSLQAMDQGAIYSLKSRYRNKVVQKIIEAIDSKKITLKNFFVGRHENARPSMR